MHTFWGSMRHVISGSNPVQAAWAGAILIALFMLAVLHHTWRNDTKKLTRWRLLCLLPLLICGAHAFFYMPHTAALDYVSFFLMMLIPAVLVLILIIFAKRKIGYRIAAVLIGIISVLSLTYSIVAAPNFWNESRKSYSESFKALAQRMDRSYILKEWKEADFSALEAKYLPMVQEAEQEQNPVKFADAVMMFANELHDGHISVAADIDEETIKQYRDTYTSPFDRREYGMAMVQLDSGEVIAVCTKDEVHALGIEDGTVITKWNGKPVLQAAAEDVPDHGFPVKANADRIAASQLSVIGGDSVEVSFLDQNGTEQTVTLSDLGELKSAQEAIIALIQLPKGGYETLMEQNGSYKMLDDKCGYLRLTAEDPGRYDSGILDYLKGSMPGAKEIFRQALSDMKQQGMEYLVVDLRCNMGGFDEIGCALCELLTDKDWYGQGLGIRKNGQYTCVSDHGIHGTGEFADLKVVALTNYECASAGDGTALYLSKLPNVTLAGITDPCGCNQETGGKCVLSDGLVTVYFPCGLVLDENCVPNVETKPDRISRNPVEERIPLDFDAAMRIFRDKEDYELDWAIKYLEEQ